MILSKTDVIFAILEQNHQRNRQRRVSIGEQVSRQPPMSTTIQLANIFQQLTFSKFVF